MAQPVLFWDASALVKRYAPEVGSATVDAVFQQGSSAVASLFGYAETFSILVRKRNRGDISAEAFGVARSALDEEVLRSGRFSLLEITGHSVLAGLVLVERQAVNVTDAAILTSFDQYRRSLPPEEPVPLLVAADQRLLRVAAGQGLRTLNPEMVLASDVGALLSSG